MKKLNQKAIILCISVLLSGCAMYYRPINPSKLNYKNINTQNGIELAYKYDVLQESGNKKYSKKEFKSDINLVAIKITNNTDSTITIGDNVAFFSDSTLLNPIEPITVNKVMQQSSTGYLLYLLFSPVNIRYTSNNFSVKLSIGFLLGAGLTIGNMVIASTANKNFLKELKKYNLINKEIKAGETTYGIIGVNIGGYSPLTIKRIKK